MALAQSNDSPSQSAPEWLSFEVHREETDQILMAKTKRSDEKLKHSFKSVRKALQRRYRPPVAPRSPGQRVRPVPGQDPLSVRVLESNRRYIDLFGRKNVTKAVLSELRMCEPFARAVEDYIDAGFIGDEIRSNVLDKGEDIMAPGLTVAELLTALMTKHKKNGWIVQDIVNSVQYFRDCLAQARTGRGGRDDLGDPRPRRRRGGWGD